MQNGLSLSFLGGSYTQKRKSAVIHEYNRRPPCKTVRLAFLRLSSIPLRAFTLHQILILDFASKLTQKIFLGLFCRIIPCTMCHGSLQTEMKQAEKLPKQPLSLSLLNHHTQWSRVCGKPKTYITISYVSCFTFKSITFVNSRIVWWLSRNLCVNKNINSSTLKSTQVQHSRENPKFIFFF